MQTAVLGEYGGGLLVFGSYDQKTTQFFDRNQNVECGAHTRHDSASSSVILPDR